MELKVGSIVLESGLPKLFYTGTIRRRERPNEGTGCYLQEYGVRGFNRNVDARGRTETPDTSSTHSAKEKASACSR